MIARRRTRSAPLALPSSTRRSVPKAPARRMASSVHACMPVRGRRLGPDPHHRARGRFPGESGPTGRRRSVHDRGGVEEERARPRRAVRRRHDPKTHGTGEAGASAPWVRQRPSVMARSGDGSPVRERRSVGGTRPGGRSNAACHRPADEEHAHERAPTQHRQAAAAPSPSSTADAAPSPPARRTAHRAADGSIRLAER